MKKTVSLILAIMLLFSMIAVSNASVYAKDPVTVYSDFTSANAGEQIRVPIFIKNNTDILGWKLTFDYDKDILTPISVDYGDVISGGLQDNIEGDMVPGSINVYWAGTDGEDYNGVMIYINFEVNASAVGNTRIDISYSQEDTFDNNFDDVYLECVPIDFYITNSGYSKYAKINASADNVVAGNDVQLKLHISEINSVTELQAVIDYNADNFEFMMLDAIGGISVKSVETEGEIALNILGITTAVNDTDFLTLTFKAKDKAMSGKYDFSVSSVEEGVICKGCSINLLPSATSEIAEIYADDVAAAYNDEITIPIYIENNHGIMGYRLDFKYDTALLQPISATCGTGFLSGCQFNDSIGVHEGEFVVLWNNVDEKYANGILCTLKFKVLTTEQVDVVVPMTYSQRDTFNEQYQDVVFHCKDISFSLNRHEHSYTSVVTAPTCTEKGYTTYTCACGDSYIDAYVDALGHKFGEYISNGDATYEYDGTKTATCERCGATDTVVDEGSKLEENAPDLSGFAIKTVSLSLHNSIKMNFKVLKTAVADFENPYMVFDGEGFNKITVTEYTEQGDYYIFSFAGISPQMMNNEVSATLYATYKENGNLYASGTRKMSVKTYAYAMLGIYAADDTESGKKLKTLIVDLLDYGAKAQVYTNYKTDKLVNADLTEAQKAWGTVETPALVNITDTAYKTVANPTAAWQGVGLVLDNAVQVRGKFTVASVENITVEVLCNGKSYIYTKDDFVANADGSYYVYFDEILAQQMGKEILMTVCENGTPCSNTMRFSVESYAKEVQDSAYAGSALDDLTQAMMRYGKSAEAYATVQKWG